MEQSLRFRGRSMTLKPKIIMKIDPVLIIPLLMLLVLHFALVQFLMLIVMSVIVIGDISGITPYELWRMLIRKTRKNNEVVLCNTSAAIRYKNLLDKGIIHE